MCRGGRALPPRREPRFPTLAPRTPVSPEPAAGVSNVRGSPEGHEGVDPGLVLPAAVPWLPRGQEWPAVASPPWHHLLMHPGPGTSRVEQDPYLATRHLVRLHAGHL